MEDNFFFFTFFNKRIYYILLLKKACSSVVLELMFPKHKVEGSIPFKPNETTKINYYYPLKTVEGKGI